MQRVVGIVFWVYLVVALLALSAYKLWVYPEQRSLFLILVNANMLLCAVAAVVGAVGPWRRAKWTSEESRKAGKGEGDDLDLEHEHEHEHEHEDEDDHEHDHVHEHDVGSGIFAWLLLVTLCCMVVGELGAFILELRSVEGTPGSMLVMGVVVRLGVAALAGWAALRPVTGVDRPSWDKPGAMAVVVGAVCGLTLVAYPLWLDGHMADALVAACAVLALAVAAVALWKGGAGNPRQTPLRFFALAGLCLYLITDLSYLRHTALSDESFVIAEVGFYFGYLMVAWGGFSDSRSEAAPDEAGG